MSSPKTTDSTEESVRLSLLQRMIGTLFSPGETFEDINRKPNWLVPALIVLVIALAANFVIIKKLDPDWKEIVRKQIEQPLKKEGKTMADLPEDQRQMYQQQIDGGAKIAPYFAYIGSAFLPIFIAFLALLYWGGAVIMGGQTAYKKVLSLTTYTFGMTLVVVQSLLSILVVFLRNPEDIDLTKGGIVVTNPGMLMPAESSALVTAILTRFDIFSIWFLVLMAIGLPRICKNMKSGTASVVVFGLWFIYAIAAVAFAAIFG